jgi:hypothetical protein
LVNKWIKNSQNNSFNKNRLIMGNLNSIQVPLWLKRHAPMQMITNLGYWIIFNEKKGVLGVGAFSQVRKVTNRKSKTVRAMKVINKTRLSTAE